MDWVLKASSSWDLTELDRDDFDALNDTSVIGQNQDMEVFSVDPGFGTLEDGTMNKWNEPKDSTKSSSPPRSSKKQRVHNSDQHLSCLVDGCTADLSSCRDYHRRHRVCESHSKTPVVTIGGKERRFCQQCSRFHSLGEFDEVKRSCRRRLDGHNRRRRKPRAASMCLNYGSFLTNHRGTKLLRFGEPPVYTTMFGSPMIWPSGEEFHQQFHVTVQQSTPSNSYARICSAREKKFPFLLGTDSDKVKRAIAEASSQQVPNTNTSADLLGEFSERLTQLVEPKGALSLLSKHTIHTSGSNPSNLVQPTGTTLQFTGPLNQHPNPLLPSGNVTGPTSGHTNNHLIGMIHFRTEGLLENEASQLLSFSWN